MDIKLAKQINFEVLKQLVPDLWSLKTKTYLTNSGNNNLDLCLGLWVTNDWFLEKHIKLIQHHANDFELDCEYRLTIDWQDETVIIDQHCLDSSEYFYGPIRSSIERARSDRMLAQILLYHLQQDDPLVEPNFPAPKQVGGRMRRWVSTLLPSSNDDDSGAGNGPVPLGPLD